MTEVQIPWVEGAKYFKVLCRLGINKPDIVDDDDRYPNLTPQGGTVEITSAVSKFRYMEPDGRSRMVYTVKASYNIQPSTGELEDVDGNVGVFLMDTSSPGVDPPNFTYTATVRPAVGEAFPVIIPGSPGSEVVDLVAHAPVSPSTGDSTIESRVAMLEQQASSGSGVDAEFVQDIVGSMVAGAGGTYDDVDGTVTLPSDAVSSVAGRTGDVVLSSDDLTDAASLATDAELASGLAGKANTSHKHGILDVTGLQTALDGKQPAGSYAASAHTHSITNVSGLQSALDGKAATGHTHAELHAHANKSALDAVSGTNTGDEPDASTTTKGIVELATTTEATAGTDTTRAVTPAGLKAATDTKAPALGADDNYVTDAEKAKLANLSGTNTGDQDLSGYLTTSAAPELIRDTMGTALVAGANVTITKDDPGDTITIAAAGGGGGGSSWSPVMTFPTPIGSYLPINAIGGHGTLTFSSNTNNSWGTVRFTPLEVVAEMSFDAFGFHVSTAATDAGAVLRAKLLDSNFNILYDLGEAEITSTGTKVVVLTTPIVLTPGLYLIASNPKAPTAVGTNPVFFANQGGLLATSSVLNDNNTVGSPLANPSNWSMSPMPFGVNTGVGPPIVPRISLRRSA